MMTIGFELPMIGSAIFSRFPLAFAPHDVLRRRRVGGVWHPIPQGCHAWALFKPRLTLLPGEIWGFLVGFHRWK